MNIGHPSTYGTRITQKASTTTQCDFQNFPNNYDEHFRGGRNSRSIHHTPAKDLLIKCSKCNSRIKSTRSPYPAVEKI